MNPHRPYICLNREKKIIGRGIMSSTKEIENDARLRNFREFINDIFRFGEVAQYVISETIKRNTSHLIAGIL